MLFASFFGALLLLQAPQPAFEVRVADTLVPLHEFPRGLFAIFEVARPVDVEIRTNFDVRWVDIRPKSLRIAPVIAADHASFRFRMEKPAPLTIEFNGEWKRVLHLFGNPPEKDAPAPDAPNVRYFGPGKHEAGAIDLKDGETLYLAPGSWVKASVNAIGSKNVTIRGRGVLESLGAQRQAQGYGGGRRNMIYLEDTEGARVEGITLVNSPTWTVYARRTNGTRIDGINILNGGGACTSDGIDLVSSSNAQVENVFIRTNDDNVVIKNLDSKDVHDITVRKAVLWNEPCGNALEIGFELRTGTIEKIRFEDIDIIRVERGAAMSIHNGDAAIVKDISYENIRVEDARHKLLDFAIVYGQYGPDRPESREERMKLMDPGGAWDGVLRVSSAEQREQLSKNRGYIRNIRVRNLQVSDALPFSLVSGWDKQHSVEGLAIENMTHNGKRVRTPAEARVSTSFATVKVR